MSPILHVRILHVRILNREGREVADVDASSTADGLAY